MVTGVFCTYVSWILVTMGGMEYREVKAGVLCSFGMKFVI